MRPTKIVVAGDPHSGKSVFLNGLFQNLPWDKRFIFRACPDGEGMWTWRGNGSEQYRIKGKFTPEMVDWYCESLAKCEMAPIVLVDVGGIPSEENRRILTEGGVDFGIILCGDISRISVWEEFLVSCRVGVLARVHSDYRGKNDVLTGEILSVHYLDREADDVVSRPTIQVVAETIKGIADLSEEVNSFLNGDVLELSQIGKAIGKTEETVVRGGKESKQIVWRGSDISLIIDFLQKFLDYLPPIIRVNGFATAFVICALVNLLRPREISVNSPDGYVAIGCNPPSGEGSGIAFQRVEEGNSWTRVSFQLNPSCPLRPSDLNNITPPELPSGSKIILSGRGPNWLFASLAMAYANSAKAIACFQPGVGSTVAITNCREVELGDLIPLT